MDGLLAYAFTLGMVAAVNPCGFALLPVYLPSFARVDEGAPGPLPRVLRAIRAAASAATGAGAVFATLGVAVSAGARVVMTWVPWAMIVVAAAMVAVGIAGLAGRPVPARLSLPTPRVPDRSMRSMFLFGVAYGAASSSCVLPLFLAGVAGAFLRTGLGTGLAGLLAFALGMATAFTALGLAVSLGRRVHWARLRRLSRYVQPLGGVLLVVVGGYLGYYWTTTLFSPVEAVPVTGVVDAVQGLVAGWLSKAGIWLGVGVAAAVLLTLLGSWLTRRLGFRAAVAFTLLLPILLIPAGLVAMRHPGSQSADSDRTGAVTPALSRSDQLLTAYAPVRHPWPAPDFALTDQTGRPVALHDLRGQVVVLSFLDDRCTDICVQYSADMLAAARELGAPARQTAFVAVNVNPFHVHVADVAAFTARTHLARLPHWYFLTGSPDRLKQVWRQYGVFVQTQGRDVAHDGIVYLIDGRGRVRATMNSGSSPGRTAQWKDAMATVVAGLLGVPAPHPSGPVPAERTGPGVTVGHNGQAPVFRLPGLREPSRRLGLTGRPGKPVVINFWASWCAPCRREMPRFEEAASTWGSRARIVGVDVNDERADALRTAVATGARYPLALDEDGRVAESYRVVNLPTTVFISPDGHVVAKHTGEISTADLNGELRELSR